MKRLGLLVAEAEAAAVEAPTDGTHTIVKTTDKDMGQLNRMGQVLQARDADQTYVLLCQNQEGWLVLMAGHVAWIEDEGRALLDALGGRGGGGKGRLQGRVDGDVAVDDVLRQLGLSS